MLMQIGYDNKRQTYFVIHADLIRHDFETESEAHFYVEVVSNEGPRYPQGIEEAEEEATKEVA